MRDYKLISAAKAAVFENGVDGIEDAIIDVLSVAGEERYALAAVYAAGTFVGHQFMMPTTDAALETLRIIKRSIRKDGSYRLTLCEEWELNQDGDITRETWYVSHVLY